MSNSRKSAFSVYKMQQQTTDKDENARKGESSSLEKRKMEKIGKTNGEDQEYEDLLSPGGKRKVNKKAAAREASNESSEEINKQGTKAFSRASRLRQSIGNITLNKKKRKTKRTGDSDSIDESSLEKDIKKPKTQTASISSEPFLKVKDESSATLLVDPVFQQEIEMFPKKKFEWLISPVKTDKFFSGLWENKPLLVKRHESCYYHGIFSTDEMDKILRENNVRFSINLDVTSYKNGKRETHNPTGRALAAVVWDFYQNGCSVRFLNPQAFSESVWKLNATLQEYFGSLVGANVYLTPPNSQGFAPHYDDIEAFVLQLEGKKHWRLYNPRKNCETLPRFSSRNLSQDELEDPVLDVILEPGDLLYFPRGTIHQADTLGGPHSLHITLSTYQNTCWGDFMEALIPKALQIAIEEDIEFRRGLPLHYLNFMGVANSESTSKERSEFLRHVELLLMKLVSYLPVDGAVDQMGIKNIHDSLPPHLNKEEKNCSVFEAGARWQDGQVANAVNVDENTALRLVRREAVRKSKAFFSSDERPTDLRPWTRYKYHQFLRMSPVLGNWDGKRLVSDEDGVLVYHNLENSRIYHEHEPQYLEFSFEASPVIEHIVKVFPAFVKVKDMPGDDLDFKVDLVTLLYEKGILITEKPLSPKVL